MKDKIREVAREYLTAGDEKVYVDSGSNYIQDDLVGVGINQEELDEAAKEVEAYIREHAEEYGYKFVNAQISTNEDNYIEAVI